MTNFVRVMTKQTKRFGKVNASVATDYQVAVEKNKITVVRDGHGGRIFRVGDTAEYDSYNLSYTGVITKITNKCVSIQAYPGSNMARTHRLDLHTFSWRNWNFDAAETARRNHEEMMYL
jgi:hypothetical protein